MHVPHKGSRECLAISGSRCHVAEDMLGRRVVERPSANGYVCLQVRVRLLEIRERLVLGNVASGRRDNREGYLDNLVVSASAEGCQ